MHCDVVSRVALDLVLGFIVACMVRVAFVVNIRGMHFDDRPADVSRF